MAETASSSPSVHSQADNQRQSGDTVDRQYIEEQAVPSESPTYLHYDDIFDRAVDNVAAVWRQVEQAA